MKDKLDKNKALKNLGTDINSEKDSADQASSSLVVVEQLSQANTTAAKPKERNTTGRKKRLTKA